MIQDGRRVADQVRDIRRSFIEASTVMAKKQVWADPFETFCFASRYQDGASVIQWFFYKNSVIEDEKTRSITRNDHLNGLSLPSSILLSLSLEVFLKCLILARGNPHNKDHEIGKLFGALTDDDQCLVRRKFSEYRQAGVAFNGMEFDSILKRMDRYFVEMRYAHDAPHPRTPEHAGVRGIYGLSDAVNAVRAVILETHPEWEAMFSAKTFAEETPLPSLLKPKDDEEEIHIP